MSPGWPILGVEIVPMPDPEKEPVIEDAGQARASVMAYFELLKGWQVPIIVETEGGVEAEGLVDVVDSARMRLTLTIRNAPAAGLGPNDTVKLYFGMEDARWMGSAIILHHRDNRRSFVMTFPKRLEPKDRRVVPRVRHLEGLSTLIRPEEFGGISYQGSILDLSEGGLQMRVEKSSGTLSEVEGELGEGQDLALVRVSGLDGEDLETTARLVHMNRTPGGLLVGLRFRNLKGDKRRALGFFLAPHIVDPPTELPPLSHPSHLALGAALTGSLDHEGGEVRTDALVRLKKRGRTLLVAADPGPVREHLLAYLTEAGYGRILTVGTLAEVMEIISSTLPIHAVIIDGGVEEMKGLELASFVHHAREGERCPILLVEDVPKGNLALLTRRAGVKRVLQKPYLTPVFLEMLEEELDLRPKEEVETPVSTLTPRTHGLIQRRSRTVALVMPPGMDRDRLADILTREGFGKVIPAGTVGELVRALQSTTLSLAFIDWPETDIQGLEIASFLASSHKDGKVAMIVAATQPNPRQIQDARALGVSQVLVKPYALDAGFADLLGAFLE